MANYKFQKGEYVTYSYRDKDIRAQVLDHVKEPGAEITQEDGVKRVAKQDDPAYKLKIVDEDSQEEKEVVKLESNLSSTD